MNAIEVKHPLVQHKVAILRDKKTGTKEFREIITEIAIFLCYEAMKDAKLEDKEIETPICAMTGKKLDEDKYAFELTTAEKEDELVLQDVRTKVDVNLAVVDEDGNKLENATVQLVDPDTQEVVYEAITNEEGVASFTDIRAGRYIRQVTDLAEQYVVPAAQELYLEEDSELVETVTVKYITASILINKTDDETGEVVPGCLFRITNEAGEVVVEERTDDNGQLLVAGLRYGVYYVEEVEAAEGYDKSDLVFEVTITEDGQTYVVDFTNVPTGDIAVALYAVIALVSVGAIALTVKRLRMN